MFENELIEAIVNDDAEQAEKLLEQGVDANSAIDSFMVRPLHFAVSKNLPHMIDLLLKYGADPTKADADGVTPIELAKMISEDSNATFELLLKMTSYTVPAELH